MFRAFQGFAPPIRMLNAFSVIIAIDNVDGSGSHRCCVPFRCTAAAANRRVMRTQPAATPTMAPTEYSYDIITLHDVYEIIQISDSLWSQTLAHPHAEQSMQTDGNYSVNFNDVFSRFGNRRQTESKQQE